MSMIEMFRKELQQESAITRKMLERIPDDKYDWKPHEKSMSIRQLSTHIAELPTWMPMVLNTEELDFATAPYEPKQIDNTADLMKYFEQSLQEGLAGLVPENEEKVNEMWVLRNGNDIYSKTTKAEFLRITMNQITHHRAQMGVFLRLLDIPIPGSYGPSADDVSF
ncbi:DinB family protein [Taibaiella lutea]|uniref:DinB family protein n=1 Tax=Taibaiella lutea TaxID=2608001 RepID=A0A5M6CIK1_9BACT|nr:DinB family protein [Taibaiella lutea]KAA5534934.1 DinB family protein [Taibaiella lutea]